MQIHYCTRLPCVSSTKNTSPCLITLVSPLLTVISTSASRLTMYCRRGALCHEKLYEGGVSLNIIPVLGTIWDSSPIAPVINPRRMREGYGTWFVIRSVNGATAISAHFCASVKVWTGWARPWLAMWFVDFAKTLSFASYGWLTLMAVLELSGDKNTHSWLARQLWVRSVLPWCYRIALECSDSSAIHALYSNKRPAVKVGVWLAIIAELALQFNS